MPAWRRIFTNALRDLETHVIVKLNQTLCTEVKLLTSKFMDAPTESLSDAQRLIGMVESEIMIHPSLTKINSGHLDKLCRSFYAKVSSGEA